MLYSLYGIGFLVFNKYWYLLLKLALKNYDIDVGWVFNPALELYKHKILGQKLSLQQRKKLDWN